MVLLELVILSGGITAYLFRRAQRDTKTLLTGESLEDGTKVEFVVPATETFLEIQYDVDETFKSEIERRTVAINTNKTGQRYGWSIVDFDLFSHRLIESRKIQNEGEYQDFLKRNGIEKTRFESHPPPLQYPFRVRECRIPRDATTYAVKTYKLLGTNQRRLVHSTIVERYFLPLTLSTVVFGVSAYKFLDGWKKWNECSYKHEQASLLQYTWNDIRPRYNLRCGRDSAAGDPSH